jgi:hypothetical protein
MAGAIVIMGAVAPLAAYALPAQAVEGQSNAPSTTTTSKQSTGTAQQVAAQTRLADAKLKACQARETAITNIMSRLSDRGTKQLSVFTTIAGRVEAFYTKSGKTLASYDTLVAAVDSTKAAATTAVDGVKSTSTGFSCISTDPKGFVMTFKTNLKAEIDALNAYKTAIKNLIVGVRSVQGTTSSTDASKTSDTTTTTPTQSTTTTSGGN